MFKKIEQYIYFISIHFQLQYFWKNRGSWNFPKFKEIGPFRFDTDNWPLCIFSLGEYVVCKKAYISKEFKVNSDVWNKDFSEYLTKLNTIIDQTKEENEAKRKVSIEENLKKKSAEIQNMLKKHP